MTIKVLERGTLALADRNTPAVLLKMTLSKDVSFPYSNRDFILTDALTVSSNVLLAQSIGTVLEWGMRTKVIEQDDPSFVETTERFLEITLHRPVK